MQHPVCPSCKSDQVEAFFRIDNAPVYSLVTVSSKEEALAVPRKDIELGFCNHCGFVFNRLFDTSIDYFAMGYEDQQGFSKTFMQYLARISENLIKKYNLANKTLLEIGCGKGDFINLLNESAGGKGIGVDPAYVDGRLNNPNLTFYKELYSAKHGKLGADFICCRHTLEHIFHTEEFLINIRDSLVSEKKPVVFLEVPQISQILKTHAFWDIYYEHCSYFSAGSLGRLFRRTGYEVLDMKLDYSDLYLLVEAVPSDAPPEDKFVIEKAVQEEKENVLKFRESISVQLEEWRTRLKKMKDTAEKVVIWGGGSKSVGFLTSFADLELIEYVVDINPNMENNFIPGIGSQYVQPQFLHEYRPDTVIIMNGVYKEEITKTINGMGLDPFIYAL